MDSSYKLTPNRFLSKEEKEGNEGVLGATHYAEYSMNAPVVAGHEDKYHKVCEFKRKGAIEIHHELAHDDEKDPISSDHMSFHSELIGTKPNATFVSTMMNRVIHHVDKGDPVRIVGKESNGMINRYHRLARAINKKLNKNYKISELESHDKISNNVAAKDYKEFIIQK